MIKIRTFKYWWVFILVVIVVAEAVTTGLLPHTKSMLFAGLASAPATVAFAALFFGLNLVILELVRAWKPYAITRTAMLRRSERTSNLISQADEKAGYPQFPQRVQEDIKQSFMLRYTVYAEFAISAGIVIYLILVNLGSPLVIFYAAVYSVISLVIARIFQPIVQRAEQDVQGKEADLREGLAEGVFEVFFEKLGRHLLLGMAIEANLKAATLHLRFDIFSKLQTAGVILVPIALFLPPLIAGSINFQQFLDETTTF